MKTAVLLALLAVANPAEMVRLGDTAVPGLLSWPVSATKMPSALLTSATQGGGSSWANVVLADNKARQQTIRSLGRKKVFFCFILRSKSGQTRGIQGVSQLLNAAMDIRIKDISDGDD